MPKALSTNSVRAKSRSCGVQRLSDGTVVFNFDRGLDVPAQDAQARAVVDFLTVELAERVFG
jgi:hypothetical protein